MRKRTDVEQAELDAAVRLQRSDPSKLTPHHREVLAREGKLDYRRPGEGDQSDGADALYQFDMFPRWLKFSGLPQALGGTDWAVYRALIELDHQVMPIASRRFDDGGWTFTAPQADVVAVTGLVERTVRNALRRLRASALLSYRHGYGSMDGRRGRWSSYRIECEPLTRLFLYVAPRLRPAHGGFAPWGVKPVPEAGVRIYGQRDHFTVIVPAEEVIAVCTQPDAPTTPEAPDADVVAEICGIQRRGSPAAQARRGAA